MRVFLDTNILVSALVTRGLCEDVLRATHKGHELLVGESVLGELRRVLRTKLGIPREKVEAFEEYLREGATVVGESPLLELQLKDASDLAVLSEALSGGADVVVTGDRELLELGREAPLPILSPRGYWTFLRDSGRPGPKRDQIDPSERG